jgi:hypothetical protein
MGTAILRIHNNVLTDLLGFRGTAEVINVLPPGAFELERQSALLIVDAPDIPPTPQGMRIPEVWAVYETRHRCPVFKGFEMLNEAKEFPSGFLSIPAAPSPEHPPIDLPSRSPPSDPGDFGVFNNETTSGDEEPDDGPSPLIGA